MLGELVELGMDLARALHARAMAEAGAAAEAPAAPRPRTGPDPALQFERIARALRRTIALQARLAQERDAHEEKRGTAEAAPRRERRQQRPPLNWIGKVDEPIERDFEDPTQLPLDEAVARICRDLGIDPTRAATLAGTQDEPATTAPDAAKPAPPATAGSHPRRPDYLAPSPGLIEAVTAARRSASGPDPP